MVPIHDTDVAQERWAQAEWQHYELWEKLEIKLRKRRNLWIVATAVVFLILSSIPILMDHSPKWASLHAARVLAEQIGWMKREAGTENSAFRLEFSPNHELSYTIRRVPSCAAPAGTGDLVRQGTLLRPSKLGSYRLLSPETGRALGIPGLVESLCYDPLLGSVTTPSADSVEGFGIVPVQDLPTAASPSVNGQTVNPLTREDRMAILIFKGPSAEISFE